MKQFDVFRNAGRNRSAIPYVVVVQSSWFDRSQRRVVVPLVSLDVLERTVRLPRSAINPEFTIEGHRVVLNPLEIVSVPVETLHEHVASLAEDGDTIIAALDELFSRAWA